MCLKVNVHVKEAPAHRMPGEQSPQVDGGYEPLERQTHEAEVYRLSYNTSVHDGKKGGVLRRTATLSAQNHHASSSSSFG